MSSQIYSKLIIWSIIYRDLNVVSVSVFWILLWSVSLPLDSGHPFLPFHPFHSLPFPSLPFPSLPFPSLPFPSHVRFSSLFPQLVPASGAFNIHDEFLTRFICMAVAVLSRSNKRCAVLRVQPCISPFNSFCSMDICMVSAVDYRQMDRMVQSRSCFRHKSITSTWRRQTRRTWSTRSTEICEWYHNAISSLG